MLGSRRKIYKRLKQQHTYTTSDPSVVALRSPITTNTNVVKRIIDVSDSFAVKGYRLETKTLES
jgi:hypothetical protein